MSTPTDRKTERRFHTLLLHNLKITTLERAVICALVFVFIILAGTNSLRSVSVSNVVLTVVCAVVIYVAVALERTVEEWFQRDR